MIRRVTPTEKDKGSLTQIEVPASQVENDHFDYSKVVVKKPWGYEYLIFENSEVAVWILNLKKDALTSMHCHPQKKTSLVVLQGEAVCSTLEDAYPRKAGQGLLIEKSVFHQTRAVSEGGAFVMEIETPVNKRDLVRLKDQYGREKQGYENAKQHAQKLKNYNYLTWDQEDIFYNTKKKFGQCSLEFKRLSSSEGLKPVFELNDEDIAIVLKGHITRNDREDNIGVGDTLPIHKLKAYPNLSIDSPVEILLIRKMDHKVKGSDVVSEFLASQSLNEVFVVPGDANMHLLDSIGRQEQLDFICAQSEKAGSFAAEASAKKNNRLAALVISGGASATDALSGVSNAWVDSVPVLVISGQAKKENQGKDLRQFGNKSLDIVEMVKPITKYAVSVTDPKEIKATLEKAAFLATSERPGPCWVDLPIDLQGLAVDEKKLTAFDPNEFEGKTKFPELTPKVKGTLRLLKSAKRPVILAGNGIRLSEAIESFQSLIKKLQIPVLTTRKGSDLLPNSDPLYYGRPGAYGQRKANFIIQNSDLVLSIGARLSIPLLGRNPKAFAREAQKIVVDIDANELKKEGLTIDLAVHADAKPFIESLEKELNHHPIESDRAPWISRCNEWRTKYDPKHENYPSEELALPYRFVRALSQAIEAPANLVVDGGYTTNYTMQAFQFKKDARLICSTGLETPGFALPASLGVALESSHELTVCLCDDVGFLKGASEIPTILENALPIKIFVLNAKGPLHLRKTQEHYFGGRTVGTESPIRHQNVDLQKIAAGYGIKSFQLNPAEDLSLALKEILSLNEPVITEIKISPHQELIPRMGFKIKSDGEWVAMPLEDLYPFLDKEELKSNLLIEPFQEHN